MATAETRALSRERVSAIAHDVLAAFESGELPQALAQLFIHRKVEVPSRLWTWTNRLIALRRGHVYAAGFRQWQEVGRSVKKGEHAFHILAPRIVKAKEDDKKRGLKEGDTITLGFLAVPVFGYYQTEGEPLAGVEDAPEFVDRLPLIEVARAWGSRSRSTPSRTRPTAWDTSHPGEESRSGPRISRPGRTSWCTRPTTASETSWPAVSTPRWSRSSAGPFSSNASGIPRRATAAAPTGT